MKFAGIDVGAETIKYVIITGSPLQISEHRIFFHQKSVESALSGILDELKQKGVERIAITGRFANLIALTHYPQQAVLRRGLQALFNDSPVTCVSIGCNGFNVFEKRSNGADTFRENARCSQGTGNFLRQLVERFDLDLAQADALCDDVENPCPLSGRCPVILKTDMTHLANRGESQAAILAGVYDAICDNVEALIKPALCPKNVVLSGGVTRSQRIRNHFERFCTEHDLSLLPSTEYSRFFIEATGCAYLAAEFGADEIPHHTQHLLRKDITPTFDTIPPLKDFLPYVKRLPVQPLAALTQKDTVFLGFDIGSTGSKAVAWIASDESNRDEPLRSVCWEGYIRTNGNPVNAARELVAMFLKAHPDHPQIAGMGVTGSGREIVGTMLASCFGSDAVYILNEIAAHAEGARAIDPRVDTIFEIGGQDAKYIRLSDGRIVDAAMNEACSAGTGSFIEEQGCKFKDISSLSQLSDLALECDAGVSLGQHCSVFMTQIIEEATAAGISTPQILAGIYDSVVLNYFYRVKGNRSVGDVVFCQGMPFCTDALPAAVARQTRSEVIVPPNPGTIGAFGIAHLAAKSLKNHSEYDLNAFLDIQLIARNTFVCNANKGCGGTGNHCKIDRITVKCRDEIRHFTWGGACTLWDHGVTAHKLPPRAPNPFDERNKKIQCILENMPKRGNPTVAIADEFQLKSFFVFFARFLYELGLDLELFRGGSLNDLKRGLDESNVRFCAPMQHYHGVASKMAASQTDFIFWPMMRCGRFSGNEEYASICPVVQSSPDLLMHDLSPKTSRVLSPMIDFGAGNLESPQFAACCKNLAQSLGTSPHTFAHAFKKAKDEQIQFDNDLLAIGRDALAFAQRENLKTIIVLGRNYTIHNSALNSNVPALLREQGAMAIPVDCYPVQDDEPLYSNIYWSYGQINLRAATQIRKTPGQYAVWCSNYGCGPDSFNLHFFQFIMQGKPYTIIETDGHSGDAGTKTRIEAFLHCISEFEQVPKLPAMRDLHAIENENMPLVQSRKIGATVVIPNMGDNADVCAAGFRNIGLDCITLPRPTRDTLHLARKYTSGKECVPALITLGSFLEYIQKAPENKKIVLFMPRSNGPCRLGCYNLFDKLVLDRLGLNQRVKIWSLCDTDYGEGVPLLTFIIIYTGFVACDTLMAALYDVRPVENTPGAADEIYQRAYRALIHCIENAPSPALWMPYAAREILTCTFFGMGDIIKTAAREFAAIKTDKRMPTVCVTGEIYVRNDPFANDFIIQELESRGIRVSFAHFSEWIEYADIINREILQSATGVSDIVVSDFVRFILRNMRKPMQKALGWGNRHDVHDILNTASKYLRKPLVGEEILTIGTPLHAYKNGEIQGVVNVGPLECMPSKIAESQFYHIAEQDGLISLNLSFNGDPIPKSVLDDFCFEVKRRFMSQK